MKSIYFSLITAVLAVAANAQDQTPGPITSGRITYEEKARLNIKLEGDAAALAGTLPKERTTEKLLTFSEEATLYENSGNNTDEEMETPDSHDGNVRIRMVVSDENKTYTDLKNNNLIEQRDFMNRVFLVEKKIPELNWKVTGNQKTILGYPCMEAFREDTSGNKAVAWFAPALKVSSGPAGLCRLPGMILEADFNNGERILTAKSIEPVAADKLKLQKPKEGKRVTDTEFRKIVDEKMKEMGIEQGGQGGGDQVRIIIKQH
jgi:GLPGLI family protein